MELFKRIRPDLKPGAKLSERARRLIEANPTRLKAADPGGKQEKSNESA